MSKNSIAELPTPEPESPLRPRKPYRFSTLCATVDNPDMKDQYGSSSVPIYQSATFKGVSGEYDYSRSGNPTRSHLEHHIAKISSAAHAFVVSSGMAALDVILRILKPGDEVIAGDDLYGGTNRLLTYIRTHGGVIIHHVDTTNPSSLLPHIHPVKTAMVLLESPTNPLLKIADLATISQQVKERAPNALIVVDNTMMSPYLQRPLEHGADIVYDSATKYLSGHHDLMAGAVTCNRDDLAKHLAFTINAVGNALTPVDSFFLLRGIKTLALRMDRQQATAELVANYLHGLGFIVHYPGLPNHPGRVIHQRIAEGNGAVLSFETGNKALSEKIVAATRLWGISVSFGCVNSLISLPCVMSHASIDPAIRAARGLPEDLIRLCVGIEDPADLLDDLERALLDAGAIIHSVSHNKYIRAADPNAADAISHAVEKLVLGGRLFEERQWFVSAPGKVILFGEHAVVYGATAIAASVDLRCYGLATPRDDGKLTVCFHDINEFYHEWTISLLPWEALKSTASGEALDQNLLTALSSGPLKEIPDTQPQAQAACTAFLYLYMVLATSKDWPSLDFTARSTLPVGAGLGSSASFSTCAASALLLAHRRIGPTISNHPTLPIDFADEVNRWAFVAEKILHGNPSGVDNSVAVYGGALAYTRAGFGRKSGMEALQGFKSLQFLLTNSKVPRDTKKLVAGVGEKRAKEPDLVGRTMDDIQSISDRARQALVDPHLSRDALLSILSALIDENHGHLVTLGVSHPVLEQIRSSTSRLPYNLSTKLTGAGGGGCAVTLVPDNFPQANLQDLTDDLTDFGFQPYLTAVGGGGLGIFAFPPKLARSQAAATDEALGETTPPKTPTRERETLLPLSDNPDLIRATFGSLSASELAAWVTGLGKWSYV